jgi:kinetochore protein Spc7/SPC105
MASPETKSIMDDQFKNVKTHARLLSKAMWYEWRMKLLDGLKEGLVKVADGMDVDDNLLLQQHRVLEPNLHILVHQHDQLEAEDKALQVRVDELNNYDQEDLNDARVELVQIEKEIDAERKLVEDMQHELRCKEDGIEHAVDHRQRCLEQIEEAEKVRLESRGWSPSEVASLHGTVSNHLNPSCYYLSSLQPALKLSKRLTVGRLPLLAEQA